ncbi:MAG: hypothetical protein GY749_05540 [Desulfobacteraceae bacterium]|nr:hypothetical protein [Desulfobacteraceae bacterium]
MGREPEQSGAEKIYRVLTSDIREIATVSGDILYCIQGTVRTVVTYTCIGFLSIHVLLLMLVLTLVAAFFYISNHTILIQILDQLRLQEIKMLGSAAQVMLNPIQ